MAAKRPFRMVTMLRRIPAPVRLLETGFSLGAVAPTVTEASRPRA
jgi:hypothetical protein